MPTGDQSGAVGGHRHEVVPITADEYGLVNVVDSIQAGVAGHQQAAVLVDHQIVNVAKIAGSRDRLVTAGAACGDSKRDGHKDDEGACTAGNRYLIMIVKAT